MIAEAQRNSDSDRKAFDKANERRFYKSRCNEKKPPGMGKCTGALWKLNKARDCKRLREKFSNKWYGGKYDDVHQALMDGLDTDIAEYEAAVDRQCKPGCAENR